MWRSTRFLWCFACMVGVLSLTGCGAGLITGIAASDRGNSSPEARVPELSVQPLMPLVPAPNTARTAVVANAQIAAAAPLRVRIEAAGVAVDQVDPTASGQGGTTAITFTLATGPIVAAVGDPTAVDVNGTLSVLVDGNPVAAAVPIVLVKQPRAELVVVGSATELFLSPLGERVRLRVPGLRSSEPTDLQVLVTTRDPTAQQPGATITRVASNVQREADEGDVPVVSAIVPGITFPVQAEIFVRDAIAGQSTTVSNAYYRPEVTLALPSQGPTTGGTLVTLIGTALVPYDFGTAPATFDFDAVQLAFEKGGRITDLERVDLRPEESGSDRLVFTMPASPDGRPGEVDIVLTVDLGPVDALVTASDEFLFGNADPYFGPRGAVLDRPPVAVAPIALDKAPSTEQAPDFAVLTEQGGVGFVQLLLAQQNGMFQPFAAPRQIGNNEVTAERGPRDLCVGDFNGDGVPDLFIANAGSGTAQHHVVLGQRAPQAPLGGVSRFAAPAGTYRCRAALLDGDTFPDVVLVPGPEADPMQRPQVLLARPEPLPPIGTGAPGFAAPIEIDVRSFPYEAFDVADLDGDGLLDFAVTSGTQGKLDVAWGLGDGSFLGSSAPPGVALDFAVPGYTLNTQSPAVGLHAAGDVPLQSLGLVLSGLLQSSVTQPTVTVLRQPSLRTYVAPVGSETSPLTPIEPIGSSLAADIDAATPLAIEFVLAMKDVPQVVSLGMLQFGSAGFELIGSSIESGIVASAEAPRNIRSLTFARAFPASATPTPGLNGSAVFIVHETAIDGVTERRLSTRLVLAPENEQPSLLAPDAGNAEGFTIDHLIDGNFHEVSIAAAGLARDLALATRAAGEVRLIRNDGFGGFPNNSDRLLGFAGLLPNSMVLLPSPTGQVDRLLVGAADSHLGVWRPGPPPAPPAPPQQSVQASTSQLRLLAPPPLATTDLTDASRMQVGDVDGDGVADLVVLMRFDVAQPGDGDGRIALLRGKPAPTENEFPFHEPTVLTSAHGLSSSLALGDFVMAEASQPRRLELAVAVPSGTPPGSANGDHIRFYRYVAGPTPADDRFQPSAVAPGPQVLLAGSAPTEIVSGDFDRNGSIDLLVACEDDSTLRLFVNTAGITSTPGEVDVGAIEESLASPNPLAAGLPTRLQLADVNGDDNPDAIVFVEFTTGTSDLSTSVATYLSAGAGLFASPRFASSTRIGNRDNGRLSGSLGDWNRDGVPDLLLGWNTFGTGDVNLRILAGGTR